MATRSPWRPTVSMSVSARLVTVVSPSPASSGPSEDGSPSPVARKPGPHCRAPDRSPRCGPRAGYAEGMSSFDSSPPVRIVLRPLGSAAPLGFFGLAVASFVYAGLQLGWAPGAEGTLVGAIVLVVAVPLQAVAAIVSFAARDGATGTSMGLQAGAWAAIGVAQILSAPGLTPESFGLLLLAAGGLLVLSAVGSGMGKLVVGLAVATLGARFVLSGLYEVTGSTSWQTAAGIVG